MKILQVNVMFQRGSTGKIVNDIHNVLRKKGIESVVCYGRERHKKICEHNVYKFCREFEGDLHHLFSLFGISLSYGGCYIPTKRLVKIIDKERPDIVHLHCINGYCVNIFKLLRYLGINNIPTVVTNHAEFFYTGNCGSAYDCQKWHYNPGCGKCPMLKFATGSIWLDKTQQSWIKMKEAFSYHKKENLTLVAVSPWGKYRMKQSPITKDYECKVVENGVDTNIFRYSQPSQTTKKLIGHTDSRPIVFHATAMFSSNPEHLKGGYYVLEIAKRMPDVKFIISSLYGHISSLPSNIVFLGKANSQQELAELYSCADVTLLTSKQETYSMVAAESLCCGTPVVGFNAGGPETIALSEYSSFVEYGNIEALIETLRKSLKQDINKEAISKEAHHRYSKERMTNTYLEIYRSFINKDITRCSY